MKKILLIVTTFAVAMTILAIATLAAAASPKLPATPFDFKDYNGLCRAAIVVTDSTPTVLIVGKLGNSSNFTLTTLTTGTTTATFEGMVDTITATSSGGGADVTWCCSQEP